MSPIDDTPPADLFDDDWPPVVVEARPLGFEVFPRGAWRGVVGGLEDQLALLVPFAERLGELAGVELPKAVEQLIAAWKENNALLERATPAEHHVGILAEAIVGEELAAIDRGDHEEDR